MNCSVCGAKMVHFENPSRNVCPEENNHGTQQRTRQDKPVGDKSPRSGKRYPGQGGHNKKR